MPQVTLINLDNSQEFLEVEVVLPVIRINGKVYIYTGEVDENGNSIWNFREQAE